MHDLQWRSWINRDFLMTPMASEPAFAGVRTAILGSLWMILITILVAFPIGVGAAIYLEEYAGRSRINQHHPDQHQQPGRCAIDYLRHARSGALCASSRTADQWCLFGVTGSNGRTILSASLTMALLILPVLIINGQEAIRAVPLSLRQASYGLGATKWQTTWHHVLPMAFPGILTGTILATHGRSARRRH